MKRASIPISKKLEILDYVSKLADACRKQGVRVHLEKAAIRKFPETLKQGMLGRWRHSARKFKWDQLPEELCKSNRGLPNHVLQALGLATKGRDLSKKCPMELQEAMDRVLHVRQHGLDGTGPLNEPIKHANIKAGLERLTSEYNTQLKLKNTEIEAANRKLLAEWKAITKRNISVLRANVLDGQTIKHMSFLHALFTLPLRTG